ncbi:HD domain-containing protein [Streptomyces sp. TLI_146]|uniref:HD domain-containing protein n=1 Tax=Streptomyces sp. TLI_146 TaxID=1938858 RepID=UPI000C711E3F|nr:HD domain-containing protein [Streptomyces sp. TLI_146]PKV86122.1 HD domain-containing protein [Streptomyces sp. TLI_146]
MLTEVAGIKVPEGHAAQAARLVCAEYADEALYHHSLRAYFFGAAWAEERGLDYDRELFFVSALLHDLSLVPPFDSHTLPFEEAGGHLARVFTAGLGWPDARRDRAAELIVLHMRDDVSPEVDLESRLLQVGTSADVSGTGLEAFSPAFQAELVAAYPRLGFASKFVDLFRDQARRKPGCAAAELVAGGWESRALGNGLDRA